jgi:hypothetical protein
VKWTGGLLGRGRGRNDQAVVLLPVFADQSMLSVIVRRTIVQLATPDEMRGRVSAVNTVPAVVLSGVGTLGIVALWAWRAWLFPELRRVDEPRSRL